MNLNPEEFASLYARLGESELVELARSYDNLLEPAQAALRQEFRRRGLEPPMIEAIAICLRRSSHALCWSLRA
jgi:hypothetical protein